MTCLSDFTAWAVRVWQHSTVHISFAYWSISLMSKVQPNKERRIKLTNSCKRILNGESQIRSLKASLKREKYPMFDNAVQFEPFLEGGNDIWKCWRISGGIAHRATASGAVPSDQRKTLRGIAPRIDCPRTALRTNGKHGLGWGGCRTQTAPEPPRDKWKRVSRWIASNRQSIWTFPNNRK